MKAFYTERYTLHMPDRYVTIEFGLTMNAYAQDGWASIDFSLCFITVLCIPQCIFLKDKHLLKPSAVCLNGVRNLFNQDFLIYFFIQFYSKSDSEPEAKAGAHLMLVSVCKAFLIFIKMIPKFDFTSVLYVHVRWLNVCAVTYLLNHKKGTYQLTHVSSSQYTPQTSHFRNISLRPYSTIKVVYCDILKQFVFCQMHCGMCRVNEEWTLYTTPFRCVN